MNLSFILLCLYHLLLISDIDLVVTSEDIVRNPHALSWIARALKERGLANNIQIIAKAKVPIIKFVTTWGEVFSIRGLLSLLHLLRWFQGRYFLEPDEWSYCWENHKQFSRTATGSTTSFSYLQGILESARYERGV